VSDFDFDHWASLARRDPPAFFRARERAIMRFINAHPEPQAARLREIQNHIDCLRAVCASPAQATRQLTAMLEDHLLALQDAMQRLLEASNDFSRSLGNPGPS
jgi:hypothetical protein